MYEIDFLPVGDGERSGDAIAMRFTRPHTGGIAQIIIDAGFQDDGEALVEHVNAYYDSDYIDLAILTHPDGDHIGGMGVVVRKLRVGALLVQNIGDRGGSSLPAADAVDDLIRTARGRGTKIYEPFSGTSAFGGAITVLGPDVDYYEELVAAQVPQEVAKAVFTSAKGMPLRRNFYKRHFLPALVRSGLDPGLCLCQAEECQERHTPLHRFHDLRHTCAALLIAQGAHPKEIQEQLGHSTIRITLDRYGHLFPSLHERLSDGLNEVFKRARESSQPAPSTEAVEMKSRRALKK